MVNDVKDPLNVPAVNMNSVVPADVEIAVVAPPKKVVAKKAVSKKVVAKKAVTPKIVEKKVVTKKAVDKKPVVKKPAAKKVTAKKVTAKKVTSKKSATKKAAAKKPVVEKVTAKKVFLVNAANPTPLAVKHEPKAKKVKLVRDSFTMPGNEYQVLQDIKKAALKAGIEIKKSELLRIGVGMLKNLTVVQLDKARSALTKLSAGRPKK